MTNSKTKSATCKLEFSGLIFSGVKVGSAGLNEELGQIEYLICDKTGTLTNNKMILRGIVIADKVYGGKFVTKEDKQIFEHFDYGRTLDFDLKDLLTDSAVKHLPYDVEIANHKLNPGPLNFKNPEFEQMKLSNPQDQIVSNFQPANSYEIKQGYFIGSQNSKGDQSRIIVPSKGKNSLLNRSKEHAKIKDRRMLADGEKSFGNEKNDQNIDAEKSWPGYPTQEPKQKKLSQNPRLGSKDKLPPMDNQIQKMLSNEFAFSPRSAFGEKEMEGKNPLSNSQVHAKKEDALQEDEIKQLLIAEEHSIIDEHVQNKKRNFENQSVYFAGDEKKSGRLSQYRSQNRNVFKKNIDSFDSERLDSSPSVKHVRTEHVNKQSDEQKHQFMRTQSFQKNTPGQKVDPNDKDMWFAMQEFDMDEIQMRKRKGSVDDYHPRKSVQIQRSDLMKSLSNWKNVVEPHKRMYPKNNIEGTYFTSYNEIVKEMFCCVSLCHELVIGEEEDEEEDYQLQSKKGNIEPKNQKSQAPKSMVYQGPSPDEIAICTTAKDLGVEFKQSNEKLMQVQFCQNLQNWEVKMVSIDCAILIIRYFRSIATESVRVFQSQMEPTTSC